MIVEIWSDMICPFCYVGKRRFEHALSELSFHDKVQVEWKSYLLDKSLKTSPEENYFEHFSNTKGIPVEQAREISLQVAQMAKSEGLEFNLDQAVVANPMNAHRLSHFAKEHGRQNEMEEILFQAYFCEGKNIDDKNELIALAQRAGLNRDQATEVLESGQYAQQVEDDFYEAHQVGVRGVPFFVFDRKYAVSGAQHEEAFTQVLKKSFKEWEGDEKSIFDSESSQGSSCGPDECN